MDSKSGNATYRWYEEEKKCVQTLHTHFKVFKGVKNFCSARKGFFLQCPENDWRQTKGGTIF